MRRKHLLLSAAGIALGLASTSPGSAEAQEMGTIAYLPLTEEEYRRDYQSWRLFLENWQREPCQHYLDPPSGFVIQHCDLMKVEAPRTAALEERTVTIIEPAAGEDLSALPPVTAYTVYFDWDQDDIRADGQSVINQASTAVRQYNIPRITVEGHADTSGPMDYNDELSQRRAAAVARALVALGIDNAMIRQEAYGESAPAVATGDGVRHEANRRVVIDLQP